MGQATEGREGCSRGSRRGGRVEPERGLSRDRWVRRNGRVGEHATAGIRVGTGVRAGMRMVGGE